MIKVDIYTDGSCLNNGQENATAGWASVLVCGDNSKQISGKVDGAKNGRAELTAVLEGLNALKPKKNMELNVTVYCDAAYIVNAFVPGKDGIRPIAYWFQHNGIKKDKKEVQNFDVWTAIKDQMVRLGLKVGTNLSFSKVAAHSGDVYNELCDKLAKKAATAAIH